MSVIFAVALIFEALSLVVEVKLRLQIMLILEEDVALLTRRDAVFSQVLTAFLTGFTQQLALALDGLLNPAAEYSGSSKSSTDWLDQLCHLGVLALFESLLDPSKVICRVILQPRRCDVSCFCVCF